MDPWVRIEMGHIMRAKETCMNLKWNHLHGLVFHILSSSYTFLILLKIHCDDTASNYWVNCVILWRDIVNKVKDQFKKVKTKFKL